MMITVVLSANMKKMVRDSVLVKKLVGIETAGSMNILFTDKTGTITTGRIECDRIITEGRSHKGLVSIKKSREIFEILTISAVRGETEALEQLSRLVDRLFTDEKISCGQDAIVSSARQHSALVRARDFIETAIGAYGIGLPSDAASSDIEMALGAISEIDGRAVSDSVVADIFSKFCVGK